MSTESGIPDFRSKGGFWERYRPIEFSDFMTSEEARRETWRRKFSAGRVFDDAKPNRGHVAIARLVAHGLVQTVITQNIDGLHQASGVPEDRIVELHGNGTYATCLACGRRYEIDDIRKRFEPNEDVPVCSCGGFIKPAVISFGQPMPLDEMQRAEGATLESDLFVAIGSSLVVYPAAGFPVMAKRRGAKLVILNREPTELDSLADLVMNVDAGDTLEKLVNALHLERQSV